MIVKRIKKLYGIDPRSWEHPADTAALSALKQLKGLDELVKVLVSVTTERSLKLMVLASCVKVSPTQYPRLNNLLDNVVDTFDWDYKPELFISQSPFLNAGVLGVKEPFIIVNSALVRSFDEGETTAILAHEMGHIMSGHALYKTLIFMLANVSLSFIPVGELVLAAIKAALAEWNRKSELTADRAEILAVQDEKPSYDILMRMAGAEDLSQVNLNDFFAQAREYEDHKSLLDSVHKLLNTVWLSHPYPVERLQELRSWAASGYYQSILDGNYLKRGLAGEDPKEDMRAGFEYYRSAMRESDDPLSNFATVVGDGIEKTVSEIGEGLEKAAAGLGDRLKDFLKPKE